MLESALVDPDRPRRWIGMSGHNPDVSPLIRRSLRKFVEGATQGSAMLAAQAYRAAYDLAMRCLPLRRSLHQDMFVEYARGIALASLEDLSQGAERLGAAIYYAKASGDLFAAAELAELQGAALRGLGEYATALDVYRDGLDALEELRIATPLQHPSAVHLQIGLAAMLETTERYDEALFQVAVARATALELGDRESLAGADVTEANVQRARGNPLAAFARILDATDGYAAIDTRLSRIMLGRVYGLAAQMALDVAEMYAQRDQLSRPSTYLELAGTFIRRGVEQARATGELGSRFFVLLADARLARVSGRVGSTLIVLEPLLTEAAQIGDPYLVIQVHTAIGQDYAARGDQEHAAEHFRRAVHAAESVSGTEIGRPARQALVRASVERF